MTPKSLGFDHVVVNFGMVDYEFTCIVGACDNVKKYVAFKFDDPGYAFERPMTGRGSFHHKQGCAPIIWIPRWPKTPQEYGTLAHEIGHVVVEMFDHIGHPIDYKTDEAYCHALGFGIRKVLEARP